MPIVELIKGMAFGTGTDLGGQIFGDALVRTTPEEIPADGGQTEDIFITLVERQEDLCQALSLSTSVSASYGAFGGSGKFDLSEEMHVHSYSVSVVIRATVLNSFAQMRDLQFKPQAIELVKNGNVSRFREQFGDFFVRGIQSGGEMCAVLQITGRDESDHSAMKATLEAGGFLGAVSASTSDAFSQSIQSACKDRSVKLRHFQVGGDTKASLDPSEMVAHALDFAAQVKKEQNKSVAFRALLVPYSTVDAPAAPNFVDIQAAREVLALLMQRRAEALTRLSSFDFVRQHPEQFVIPAGLNVRDITGRFDTAIAALKSAASRCVNKPSESSEAQTSVAGLDIPQEELPGRRTVDKAEADVADARGDAAVNQDVRALQIRNALPDADARRGFNLAFGLAGGQTAPGPGKDAFCAALPVAQQSGFVTAVTYFLVRNNNLARIAAGEAVANGIPEVAEARKRGGDGFFSLGFDIASGVYGDPALGAQGITDPVPGTGQVTVRESLTERGRIGFDAAKKLHQGPPPLRRK